MCKYCTAQPFLRGYPQKVELTCGHFNGPACAPMLFIHGAHRTVFVAELVVLASVNYFFRHYLEGLLLD